MTGINWKMIRNSGLWGGGGTNILITTDVTVKINENQKKNSKMILTCKNY